LVSRELIAVGDTAVLTITVSNGAPDPALDLSLKLPTPDGAVAEPGPNTISPTQGWQWTLPRLEQYSSASFTGALRVVRMPKGNALLLRPEATARGLSFAAREVGGAVVIDRAHGPATTVFTPGADATLRSSDGTVTVRFPSGGFDRRLTLRHTPHVRPSNAPPVVGFKRAIETFTLDATDDQGADIHQFTQPLTVTIGYTPEQLQAVGIAENDLTLFWFDPQQGAWVSIGATIDSQAHTATAIVDHFTGFALSDGSSPSEAYIPSLQGWQVSLFTGAATYSYPIDVPAGPSGIKPSLELSYSSAATDGASGLREKQQSSWVGKGWSLDTGSISLNKVVDGGYTTRYYTMVLNGQSFDLMRGAQLPGNSGSEDQDPTHWEWHPSDESFIRVRAVTNGLSIASTPGVGPEGIHAGGNPNDGFGRGGTLQGASQPRYKWQVWTKDGTLFEFEEDLWWGIKQCNNALVLELEAYKWLLSRAIDTHRNKITYNYDRYSVVGPAVADGECDHRTMQGTVDRDAWPASITWGANTATGATHRYKVVFNSTTRQIDTNPDDGAASSQYVGSNGIPRETRLLQSIEVHSNSTGTWDLMRQYTLGHDATLTADNMSCPTTTCTANTAAKIALTSITPAGKLGTPLPQTQFTYGAFGFTTQGTSPNVRFYPAGEWNRLKTVNNGQGGLLTFNYESIGHALDQGLFSNNRRVTSKVISDGLNHTYSWTYQYGPPNYNTLGNTRGSQARSWWHSSYYGTKDYPNSAALYYNAFIDPDYSNKEKLAHARLKEFRGHEWVIETDPTTAKTKHWFYQGESVDAAGLPTQCIPYSTRLGIVGNPCFQQLRNGEFLKGREYKTESFAIGVTPDANGKFTTAPLHSTEHVFTVDFKEYGDALSGLWRAFS
jgi:hypothetical protein